MATREDLETHARVLGLELKQRLPSGTGFVLLTFNYGPNGSVGFVSTVERADAISLVEEWLAHMKGE